MGPRMIVTTGWKPLAVARVSRTTRASQAPRSRLGALCVTHGDTCRDFQSV